MLDVRHATVAFSAPGGPLVRAVDDISLTIPAGTFVVVIGTNGSGKSTLLGAIAGTVRLDAGSIHVAGHELTAWRENRRARYVGRVFQDPRPGIIMPGSKLGRYTANVAVAQVKAGRRLFFPSWLRHSVPSHEGPAERISIAFNFMFTNFAETIAAPTWKPSAGDSL